jgi:hypothetical protein
MRLLLLPSALVIALTATAHATTQDARKICTERYDTEKAGGTIPVGMSKSTYMNQCTGSIRRAAKLEKELADQASETGAGQAGSNEVTTSTTPAKPAATLNKPARVLTIAGPKGS